MKPQRWSFPSRLSRSAARWAMAGACALLAACAALRDDGSVYREDYSISAGVVRITTSDPAAFTDARNHSDETPRERRVWLDMLLIHLAERAAAVLTNDLRLEVRITDVQRAGGLGPWPGPGGTEVRIVVENDSPSIELEFTLSTEDGTVLREGRRQLRDPAFLRNPGLHEGGALRYEKRLLDAWVEREFISGR